MSAGVLGGEEEDSEAREDSMRRAGMHSPRRTGPHSPRRGMHSPSATSSNNANDNAGGSQNGAANGTATNAQGQPSGGMSKKSGDELLDEDSLILTIKASTFLRPSWLKAVGFAFLNLITLGMISLACHWYPSLLTTLRYDVVDEGKAHLYYQPLLCWVNGEC